MIYKSKMTSYLVKVPSCDARDDGRKINQLVKTELRVKTKADRGSATDVVSGGPDNQKPTEACARNG